MVNVNNPQPMTLMGERTPRALIFKSESHKLNQAFTVKEGEKIYQGMPVQLESDGSIAPYLGEEGSIYLGVAHTDNIAPAYQAQRGYPVEVTVMVEGFVIVQGFPAEDRTICGFVNPTKDIVAPGFVKYEASDDETKFINITPANAGEVMQILIR